MKTLEAYLIDSAHRGLTEHRLSITRGPAGEVRINLRPDSILGDAIDLEVRGDHVSAPMPVIEPLATKAEVAEIEAHVAVLAKHVVMRF